MTLTDSLKKIREDGVNQLSDEMRVLFRQSMQDIAALNIVSSSLKKGDTAPEFILPSATDREISLSTLLRDGPVIISFYRGAWCRFCNQELISLQENLSEINQLNSSLLGISPQEPSSAHEMIKETKITYELLHDRRNVVAKQFGVAFTFPESSRELNERLGINILSFVDDDEPELPIPATFIVDQDRTIRFAFVDSDYTRRADPIDIITVLRRIQDGRD